MMTVHEVSKRTGVSIRTLHYYDQMDLLKPNAQTDAGYRLYDESALERLQQIELLTLKKEHLENLISFARGLQGIGVKNMDFSASDTSKIDEYSKRAKEQWGKTDAYQEYKEKSKNWTDEDEKAIMRDMMQIFVEFGQLKDLDPANVQAQEQVRKLQAYITDHFYHCTDEILGSLGKMYAGGGEFTENIDKAGGDGTAVFAAKAIAYHCEKHTEI